MRLLGWSSAFFRISRSALQLRHFALEPRTDLELLRLRLVVAKRNVLRIAGELIHPVAHDVRMLGSATPAHSARHVRHLAGLNETSRCAILLVRRAAVS